MEEQFLKRIKTIILFLCVLHVRDNFQTKCAQNGVHQISSCLVCRFSCRKNEKIARPTCKRIYRNQSILLLYILGMSTCAPLQSIVDIIRLTIHLSSKIVSVNAYPPVPLLTEIHRSVVSRLLFHFVFVIFHVMCISKQQSRAAPANVYLSLITP